MKVVREDIIDAACKAKIVPAPHKLRDDLTLSDQGVDSLGIFGLILLLQERYGLEIPDDDIDQLVTIPRIIDYLNRRCGA